MLPSALGSRDTSDSTMPAVKRSKVAVSATVPVRADAVLSSASFAFSDRNGPSRGTNSLSAKLLALVRLDRKSVLQGKSVSVRVDLGGGRFINKTNIFVYITF